jgi:transcriptional regulator with GAF, ATPase, and Fis domain
MVEGSVPSYHQALIQHKKQIILRAMEQAKNNHAEAARLLGVHPNYLHRLMTNLNLSSAAKM